MKNSRFLTSLILLSCGFVLGALITPPLNDQWLFHGAGDSKPSLKKYVTFFYGLDEHTKEVPSTSIIPDGEYSIFLLPQVVREYTDAPYVAEWDWASLTMSSIPSPSCVVSISDGLGVKILNSTKVVSEENSFKERRVGFKGYIRNNSQTLFIKDNLITDGSRFFVYDADFSKSLFLLLKQCGKMEEARDRELPMP